MTELSDDLTHRLDMDQLRRIFFDASVDYQWNGDADAGRVMLVGVDQGVSATHGSVALGPWMEALEEFQEPSPAMLGSNRGAGFSWTKTEKAAFKREAEANEARANELKRYRGLLKDQISVESILRDIKPLNQCNDSDASLAAAIQAQLKWFVLLCFLYNGPEAVRVRRRSEILDRRWNASMMRLVAEDAPKAALEAEANGQLFLQKNVRPSMRPAKIRAKKVGTTQRRNWSFRKKKKGKDASRQGLPSEPEAKRSKNVDKPSSPTLQYSRLIVGIDGRNGGSKEIAVLKRLAKTQRYRGRVAIGKIDGYRTSKQAAPELTVFSGERANRRQPTPADLKEAGMQHMPKSRFKTLFDPVLNKMRQRDRDVFLAIAEQLAVKLFLPSDHQVAVNFDKRYGRQHLKDFTGQAGSQQKVAATGAQVRDKGD